MSVDIQNGKEVELPSGVRFKLGEGFSPPTMEKPKPKIKPGVTNTPQFKKFFEGSKVVDEKGEPKVLYHGTTKDISIFQKQLQHRS